MFVRIKHPEHLKYSDPGKTLRMYHEDKLPDIIAGWMIVVSLKHPLRAIYGSDFKAGWALLTDAVIGKIKWQMLSLRSWLHDKGIWRDKEYAEMEKEDAKNEFNDAG